MFSGIRAIEFQHFALKPEVCKIWVKISEMDWTCSVRYGLRVNVQKDAWLVSAGRFVWFCSQLSEIAIF